MGCDHVGVGVPRLWGGGVQVRGGEGSHNIWRHHQVNLFCTNVFTQGQFWPLGIVVACVCVCQSLACLCNNSGPVQARITKFGPKMQNTLVKVSIVLWTDWPWPSRSNLTWNPNLPHFEFVRTITYHLFKLGSPNLDQRCKIHWFRSLLLWGQLTLQEIDFVKFDLEVKFSGCTTTGNA